MDKRGGYRRKAEKPQKEILLVAYRRWQEGETLREIAKDFNIGEATLKKWFVSEDLMR